jgi:hypothetical protein
MLAAAALLASLASAPAQGSAIAPGVDLFATQPGQSYQSFSATPIPPDFFGPGSDPFDGIINFLGSPLGPLGPTDTVVERLAGASLSDCLTPVTVPIEIVALSLVSVNPITVTSNGGLNPQPWDVRVALSSQPQQQGTMSVRRQHADGGTFTATLPVQAKFVFTQVADPGNVRVLDTGGIMPPVSFSSTGHWTHTAPGFDVVTSPGGIPIDHDLDPGTPNKIIGASSNFIAGMRGVGGACGKLPDAYGKTLTEEEALLARHGVLPPQEGPPQGGREGATCLADRTCMVTTPGYATAIGGEYRGDNTYCAGDANDDGFDDACLGTYIPGMSPSGLTLLLIGLAGAGLWFVARRRAAGDSAA